MTATSDSPRLSFASIEAMLAVGRETLGVFTSIAARRLPHAIAGDAHAAINAKTRLQESCRILIVHVEQIVDAAENLDLVVDRVVSRHIHDCVGGSQQPLNTEITADIDE